MCRLGMPRRTRCWRQADWLSRSPHRKKDTCLILSGQSLYRTCLSGRARSSRPTSWQGAVAGHLLGNLATCCSTLRFR